MSHVDGVKARIQDLNVLKAACKEMGLEFREGQTTHRWYGRFLNDWRNKERAAVFNGFDPSQFGKCIHAIRDPKNPNAYEVGVIQSPDGKGYALIYDAYGGGMGLESVIGVRASKLRQEYNAQVALKQARAKGYQATIQRQGQKVQVVINTAGGGQWR